MLYVEDIKRIIPHRHPFLLVDRVETLEIGKRAIAKKAVSMNEPYFQGHFPEKAVMPGVLILEALAQTGAIILLSMEEYQGKLAYFGGADKVRFKRQVRPGDTLTLEVELLNLKGNFGIGMAKAYVEGEVAVEATITFAIGEASSDLR